MKIFYRLLGTVIALGFLTPAAALEIPLKQGGAQGVSVGFVDMEAVFQEYPETQKAKNEYYAELTTRREALAEREKELIELSEQLAVLRTSLTEAPPVKLLEPTLPEDVQTSTSAPAGASALFLEMSTAAAASVRESLVQRERLLAEKEKALEQSKGEAVLTLKSLEERRSLQIFGKLYTALTQIAEEQGVGLVVDKSSILYGETAMDLTDRLRRRIRGLPEPSSVENLPGATR